MFPWILGISAAFLILGVLVLVVEGAFTAYASTRPSDLSDALKSKSAHEANEEAERMSAWGATRSFVRMRSRVIRAIGWALIAIGTVLLAFSPVVLRSV